MQLVYDPKSPKIFDKDTRWVLNQAIAEYQNDKAKYDKIYAYTVTGNTQLYKPYAHNDHRTNIYVRTNFIKKFIREEVSYLLANKITYVAKEHHDMVDVVTDTMKMWDKNHDKDFLRDVLSYGVGYEIYYTKTETIAGKTETVLLSKVISPRFGYMIKDSRTDTNIAFMHFYTLKFDRTNKQYIDLYTKDYIFHLDTTLSEIYPPTVNTFGVLPVVEGLISDNGIYDTLYNELRDLVDAYETNLSDIVNEISDYRLAYLVMTGCEIDDVEKDEETGKTDLDRMKAEGVMQIPVPDAKINFLTKEINDDFVQNTLTTIKSNIYEISNHVNTNEKMSSNLSGTAVRSRLIGLEQSIKNSEGVMKNVISQRLKFILEWHNKLHRTKYDYREITAKFVLNIPRDDMNMAQTLSQLPEGYVSKATGRAQLSFVDNPIREAELVKQEQEAEVELIFDFDEKQQEHLKETDQIPTPTNIMQSVGSNINAMKNSVGSKENSQNNQTPNNPNPKQPSDQEQDVIDYKSDSKPKQAKEKNGMNDHNKKLKQMRQTKNE